MLKRIQRVIDWLGPTRTRVIFVLLAVTGLLSLMLNAVNIKDHPAAWVPPVQSALLVAFLVGAAIAVVSRFGPDTRRQAALIVGPALVAISLGILFPSLILFFVPVGLGWMVIAPVAMRGRVSKEYQTAIKHMRKSEYPQAIKVISALIDREPDKSEHYRFRAELYRLSGKIKRARTDYQRVIDLEPESGVGYNGLAEVYLQDGEYAEALPFARQALEREPDSWITLYNLGMIEDRLKIWADAVKHLNSALEVGVPDSRHRLLTHLWLARSHFAQNQRAEAEREIEKLRRERGGLREWKEIFESEQAAVLRNVLLEDVELAEKLADNGTALDALAHMKENP